MYLLIFAQLQMSSPPMTIVTLLAALEELFVDFQQAQITA